MGLQWEGWEHHFPTIFLVMSFYHQLCRLLQAREVGGKRRADKALLMPVLLSHLRVFSCPLLARKKAFCFFGFSVMDNLLFCFVTKPEYAKPIGWSKARVSNTPHHIMWHHVLWLFFALLLWVQQFDTPGLKYLIRHTSASAFPLNTITLRLLCRRNWKCSLFLQLSFIMPAFYVSPS